MTTRRSAVALGSVIVLALVAIRAPLAQTLQRGIYTSVLDKDGNPVAGLTPADFIVREDNIAREVLRVEPATLFVASLVKTMRHSAPAISFAQPSFLSRSSPSQSLEGSPALSRKKPVQLRVCKYKL